MEDHDAVVTTLGVLFEQEYKDAQSGTPSPFKVIKNVLESVGGSRGNPLKRGAGERSYERLNRDSGAFFLFSLLSFSLPAFPCQPLRNAATIVLTLFSSRSHLPLPFLPIHPFLLPSFLFLLTRNTNNLPLRLHLRRRHLPSLRPRPLHPKQTRSGASDREVVVGGSGGRRGEENETGFRAAECVPFLPFLSPCERRTDSRAREQA